MSVIGEKIPESEVSYEPDQVVDGEHGPEVKGAYYYRVSDRARVVWVNPAREVSVVAGGYFALYAGPADAYQPVVSA